MKRDLKAKSKSGTKAVIVDNAKKRLESLQFLCWLDSYTRPRKGKNNMDSFDIEEEDDDQEETIQDDDLDEFDDGKTNDETLISSGDSPDQLNLPQPLTDLPQPVAVEKVTDQSYVCHSSSINVNTSKNPLKRKMSQPSKHQSKVKSMPDPEIELLKSITQSLEKNGEPDTFQTFGNMIAQKLRRMAANKVLTDESLDDLEFEILLVIQRKSVQCRQAMYFQTEKNLQYKNL